MVKQIADVNGSPGAQVQAAAVVAADQAAIHATSAASSADQAAQHASKAENSAGRAADHAAKSQTSADQAAGHSSTAANSVNQAAGHATDAAESVRQAAGHAAVAQAAEARLNRPTGSTYTLVIAILGLTLIGLIVGDMISALSGNHTVDTNLMSATTLIAGGLIGVLAPSPK